MTSYSRRALVGDIGGTNIRFAISDLDELTIADFASLHSADFPGPAAALAQYLRSVPGCPALVGLAVAGQVSAAGATMTNLPWSFTREDILAVTGAERVCLVNDFEAIALALPHLTDTDLRPLGGGSAVPGAARAVLGPGTGLGVAGLVPGSGGGWVAVPSEGGHMSFGATSAAESALFEAMRGELDYLGAEHLLSGAGLVRLYRILCGREGRAPVATTAPELARAALVEHDATARAALRQFVVWLGRFAGDVALLYGARGGVYLGGGIAPAIHEVLAEGDFRAAFETRGRLSGYVAAIPVHAIKPGADAGLRGAAVALSALASAR